MTEKTMDVFFLDDKRWNYHNLLLCCIIVYEDGTDDLEIIGLRLRGRRQKKVWNYKCVSTWTLRSFQSD